MKRILSLCDKYLNGEFEVYTADIDFIDFLLSFKKPFGIPFPIKITPEVAKHIIDVHNEHNRKHTESSSSSLAKQIENDEWQLNGEPFIFLSDGNVGDCQHRSYGCIKSDKPIDVFIVCGIDPKVMPTIDSGKSRSNADCLSLKNKDRNKDSLLASIVTCAINNIKGYFAEHGSSSTRPTAPTRLEVDKFYDKYEDLCNEIHDYTKEWKKNLSKNNHILTPREMGGFALYFIIKGCNHAKVTEYFNIFVNGTYGNTTLMKSVHDKICKTNVKDMRLRAQYIIKGWNNFINEDFDRTINKTKEVPSLIIK